MKSKQLRTFIVDDKEMVFNQRLFKDLFLKNAAKNGYGVGNYEYEVADALFVDKSAVHNWRFGVNGPGDLEKIQSLANLWNINFEVLLMEVTTMTTTTLKTGLTDREKTALKNVYTSFIKYMDIFEKTVGFIWEEDGSCYDLRMAYHLYDQTRLALELEYVDLKKSVYEELKKLYDTELTYTIEVCYNPDEGDTPELQEAESLALYEQIVGKFREIIDPYLLG